MIWKLNSIKISKLVSEIRKKSVKCLEKRQNDNHELYFNVKKVFVS